ncbi:hypothetical protein PV11_03252 [Exophiala sideris]|uniref:Uncharacterized protein n=1 Tax=Exophiala sideris TaxID=1016849 RepID=A0A0D1XHR6_9EURO|nr:hypothetical protein PV11_03252 [Exophiala sideris]
MADALDQSSEIYQGFWIDWSRGRTWGLTWTLSPTHATILTNSLALFVSIAAIQLWNIIRYTLHQTGGSRPPETATPHLRTEQFILRNAGSSLATAGHMLSLACTSRRSTKRRSRRSYAIGLLALIYAALFMTAGIFSNRAISAASTNGGSAVLVRSKQCGVWNQTYYDIVSYEGFENEEYFGLYTQYQAKVAHDVQLSLEYAQECYLSQASTQISTSVSGPAPSNASSLCHTFRSPKLTWENSTGFCPFETQMCRNDSKVVVLETGHIDSHTDLGINSDPNDRLRYQRKMTCAVLDGTGLVRGWDGTTVNSSEPKPLSQTASAFFGPSLYKNTEYTYSVTNFASFYDNFTSQVTLPYQLDSEMVYGLADPQWSTSDFEPIQELVQTAADLTLFFLSFTGMYLGPIDDPWFSAHKEQDFPHVPTFLEQRYARDTAISTLACTEQHQFCTSNDTCTGFLGYDQVQNVEPFYNALSPHQNATFDRLIRAVQASSVARLTENLALTTTPMLASSLTKTGSSGDVVSQTMPNYQWEMELTFWFSIAMAQLQRTIVQWGTGQIAADPVYLISPGLEQDKWFCKNLMVPSTVYQSFSVPAIAFVIAFGTLIIVVSVLVEQIATLIRKCLGKSPPEDDWEDDNMLGIPRSMIQRLGGSQRVARDNSHRSICRQCKARRSVELQNIQRNLTSHRNSSQVLPTNDPSYSFVNRPLISTEGRTQIRPDHSPAQGSWMTISLGTPASTSFPEMIREVLGGQPDNDERRPGPVADRSPLGWHSRRSQLAQIPASWTPGQDGLAIRQLTSHSDNTYSTVCIHQAEV